MGLWVWQQCVLHINNHSQNPFFFFFGVFFELEFVGRWSWDCTDICVITGIWIYTGRGIFLRFLKCSHPAFPSQNHSTNQMNVHIGACAGSDSPWSSAPWLMFVLGGRREERRRERGEEEKERGEGYFCAVLRTSAFSERSSLSDFSLQGSGELCKPSTSVLHLGKTFSCFSVSTEIL